MTITYAEATQRLLRLMDDEAQTSLTNELLVDAFAAGLDAILPWEPKLQTFTLEKGSLVATLPTDLYAVEAVADGTGNIIPKAYLTPESYVGSNTSTNNWLIYPTGSITFAKALGVDYILYYLAHWTPPTKETQDTDLLDVPDKRFLGVLFYAGAYSMTPRSVSLSEIRQFNTKVDSGNPEHNPNQKVADWLLRRFSEEMNRHGSYQPGGN